MLLLFLSGQRGQVLQVLDIRCMSLPSSMVTFQIGDLLKTSRPGHHFSQLTFTAYTPDHRLCVFAALQDYFQCTADILGNITCLLLTTRNPCNAA